MNEVKGYDVVIRLDGSAPETPTPTPEPAPQPAPEPQQQVEEVLGDKPNSFTMKSLKQFAGYGLAVGVAHQAFSWGTSIIGRNSGNSIVQSRINTTLALATKGAALGGGLIASAATLNVPGLIASISGLVMEGISTAREVEQNAYERRWENTDILLSRERGGSALNRSRL